MSISILDKSLIIDIFYDEFASDFDDNICIRFKENCPADEKILKSDITNIYITPEEACLLQLTLQRAVKKQRATCQEESA